MMTAAGWVLGGLSPEQRCVLGFPSISSPYWTEATVAAVKRRYGGAIDVRPYADAVARRVEDGEQGALEGEGGAGAGEPAMVAPRAKL